jgi:hypothetical protein
MLIHIGYELVFNLPAPVSMQLMLYLRPESAHVLQKPEHVILEPDVPITTTIDTFGNRVARILAPAGTLRVYYDNIAWDSGVHEPTIKDKIVHPVETLPDECIPFLLSSLGAGAGGDGLGAQPRYLRVRVCPSDQVGFRCL